MKRVINVCLILLAIGAFSSCQTDEELFVYSDKFTEQQLAAKELAGVWSNAQDVKTPVGVKSDILQSLRVVFKVDEEGNPTFFAADGAEMVFVLEEGKWSWANDKTTKSILLEYVGPIFFFHVEWVRKNALKISFRAKWEDKDGKKGEGDFQVVLSRQE